MANYKGQREQFRGRSGPQDISKDIQEIVQIFKLFFKRLF
jgi:hypothetical protein